MLFWNTILLNKNYKRIIIIFTFLDYYLKVQESHFFQAIWQDNRISNF
jgi:hypothetical protein